MRIKKDQEIISAGDELHFKGKHEFFVTAIHSVGKLTVGELKRYSFDAIEFQGVVYREPNER
jgi:hypothetical protein